MTNDSTNIARISYGKDSLKMLEVIKSRGLPLDRITTTDVWATDTISARLPPMEEFVARMDQRIWDMYHIQVEHLCARNKDGTKKTYEQMFYHVPVRRSQNSKVEREPGSGPDRYSDFRIYGTRGARLHSNGIPSHRVQGTITGFPPNTGYNWCQKLKIPWGGEIKGFPLATGVTWCQNLKIRVGETRDTRYKNHPGAENSKSTKSKPLFSRARDRNAQRQKYCGIHWYCC